jgi:tetratricopeptide (TPR) repeat protein
VPLRQALAAYDAGRLADAENALGRAIALEPRWADAYYDRGVVRAARGDRENARRDFEQYLRLRPEAEDRPAVVARVEALGRSPASPAQALALGLVLPGAGQFYTGRPLAGFAALGGAVGALAYGFQTQTRSIEVTQQATDPFGNPYTYTTTQRISERPHTAIGVGAVAAILIGGGIEAYRYARRTSTPTRVSVRAVGDALVLSVPVR